MKAALIMGMVALAGCAGVQRKQFGHVEVRVLDPLVNTQLYTTVDFGIEEGHIFAGPPFAATDFEIAVMDDGCLRGGGARSSRILAFCSDATDAKSAPEDDFGVHRWHQVGGGTGFFSVALRQGGELLEIEAGAQRAEVALGSGQAAAEIRRHPELLGAAFARGLFPAAKSDAQSDWDHKEWKYVLSAR